jgi:UDP-3-O-[3-hydroxymyristoyl] glucosamine N-acyltransferase
MASSHTTGSIARLLEASLVGPADLVITGVEAISLSRPGHLTFIRSHEFAVQWARCGASAALVAPGLDVPGHDPGARALLLVPDADLAMIRVLEEFAPPAVRAVSGVHPTAVVDPSAKLGVEVSIGAHCLVGSGTVVGDGTVLEHRVTLGHDVRVGSRCILRAGVTILDRCMLGDRCVLNPGVVIGTDGFGYRPAASGKGVVKIPHIGYVRIEDEVEIGANACIDRGKFGPTVIGAGTKIDNLVQIAHNCVVGRSCLICGQAALAGSTIMGEGSILGGQVGVADASRIAAGTTVGAQSGVHGSIGPGVYLGTPARPASEMARIYAAVGKLDELLKRVRRLERVVSPDADARP